MLKLKYIIVMVNLIVASFQATFLAASPAGKDRTEALTYTAQRRPRVTVMQFTDTNTQAVNGGYGSSVSAMLVTYLKRESQLVVVERQDLDHVLKEWKRSQGGETAEPLDAKELALLSRIDVIIQGNVTVLGKKIEVDAKLLSRHDGRIISAAQRGGPISCLRQVVDRIGILLEHDFLRPYYGRLKVVFSDPENTHFHLTPVLTSNALDEEKPPVELSSTVYPGDGQDRVERWIANPSTYVIKNVLSGWYTLRLERPGYENVANVENERFLVISTGGRSHVFYLDEGGVKTRVDHAEGAPWSRFLVRVDPLSISVIDANSLGFELRKKEGRINLAIYGESDDLLGSTRIAVRNLDLEINPQSPDPTELGIEMVDEDAAVEERIQATQEVVEGQTTDAVRTLDRAKETGLDTVTQASTRELTSFDGSGVVTADDQRSGRDGDPCDFFFEEEISYAAVGQKVFRSNQRFDIASFKGGHLAIEDYHGEALPVGTYEVFLWSPNYRLRRLVIRVSDGDGDGDSKKVRLVRLTRELDLFGGAEAKVHVRGTETGHRDIFTLDSKAGSKTIMLPVDEYEFHSEMAGLESWTITIDDLIDQHDPPSMEELFALEPEEIASYGVNTEPYPLPIKNRAWVGGRFDGFLHDPRFFYYTAVSEVLDRILGISQSERRLNQMFYEDNDLAELKNHLKYIDLLILDELDTSRIRVLPAVAALIQQFIDDGHAVLAFVSDKGDYGSLFGESLSIRGKRKSRSLKLRPGQVRNFSLDYKINLGTPHTEARAKKRVKVDPAWRVVSYAKKTRNPRIFEHGSLDEGGYVMVWLEESNVSAFHPVICRLSKAGEDGSEEDEAQEEDCGKKYRKRFERQLAAQWKEHDAETNLWLAKAEVKSRALSWAECLMYRRMDGDGRHEKICRRRLF